MLLEDKIIDSAESVASELLVPGSRHFILRKSLMPCHFSSTMRKLFPATQSSTHLRANCCRRMRFCIE